MKFNVEKYGNPFLIGFVILFFSEIAIMSSKVDMLYNAPALYWVFVIPATLRLAHTLANDAIATFIRGYFTHVVPDSAGGSFCVEAIPGNGLRNAVGKLLECPLCTGTWSAVFLLSAYAILPSIGWTFALFLGVAGYYEILHYITEWLEWGGRHQREQAGSEWLWKNAIQEEKIVK